MKRDFQTVHQGAQAIKGACEEDGRSIITKGTASGPTSPLQHLPPLHVELWLGI